MLATVSSLALAMGFVAFRAQADQWDKKTILTINQPIQVRDTYLEPGTYVFKLLNSDSDRHIVQIFNKDQSRIINTVMAINNSRMTPRGHSTFEFWETPPGTARAMRAWFYPGDTYGQEFPYPKHLRQLETASVASTATVSTPPAPAAEPAPAPTAVAETEAAAPSQTASPEAPAAPAPNYNAAEQQEIAQAVPPPATSTPVQENPAPVTRTERPSNTSSMELPKTATSYPAIGLGGTLLLGLYGWLRSSRRRTELL